MHTFQNPPPCCCWTLCPVHSTCFVACLPTLWRPQRISYSVADHGRCENKFDTNVTLVVLAAGEGQPPETCDNNSNPLLLLWANAPNALDILVTCLPTLCMPQCITYPTADQSRCNEQARHDNTEHSDGDAAAAWRTSHTRTDNNEPQAPQHRPENVPTKVAVVVLALAAPGAHTVAVTRCRTSCVVMPHSAVHDACNTNTGRTDMLSV